MLIPRNVTHKCNQIRDIIRNNYEGNDIYGIYRLCPKIKSKYPLYYNKKHSIKNFISDKFNPNKNKKLKNDNLGNIEPENIIWPNGCGEDLTFDNFLNDPIIKDKLKIYNSSFIWTQCYDINYEMSESFSFYSETLLKYPNLNVWVFSGTDDAVFQHLEQ